MPLWYYRGTITTCVDLPGKEGAVIRPKTRFVAERAAVAHLLTMKPPQVVEVRQKPAKPAVKPAVEQKKEAPAPEPPPAPVVEAPKSEGSKEGDASEIPSVVGSSTTEDVSEVSGVTNEPGPVASGEDGAASSSDEEGQEKEPEEEKKKTRRGRKKRR
jgi:hypothetical protein